jgi:hypothetical protein
MCELKNQLAHELNLGGGTLLATQFVCVGFHSPPGDGAPHGMGTLLAAQFVCVGFHSAPGYGA